jgi:leucyl/phenylalanyl-tRNA--protein transferase
MDCLRQDFASLFSEGVAQGPDTTPWGVRRRRDLVFRETLLTTVTRRFHNAGAWARPRAFDWLARRLALPQDHPALPSFAQIAAGLGDLCGPVTDLSASALFDLYARGLYIEPFGGLVGWRAPAVREVADLSCGRALDMRGEIGWSVTFDSDFDKIIALCARPGRAIVHAGGGPTWFAPKLLQAFAELFDAGVAHSFEVVDPSGHLVGGGYGIAIGRIFVTEAWFSRRPGGGEAGLDHLNRRLAQWGYILNDIKSRHSPGFEPISRGAYMQALGSNLAGGRHGRWRHG